MLREDGGGGGKDEQRMEVLIFVDTQWSGTQVCMQVPLALGVLSSIAVGCGQRKSLWSR